MMPFEMSCVTLLEGVGMLYGKVVVCFYIKNFITIRSLHDPKGLGLHCRCGGYIDPTQDTMASNLISQPACAIAKLSTIIKIHKYKRFHERYHFISMAMEVHDTSRCDLDRFIRECAHLFHNK